MTNDEQQLLQQCIASGQVSQAQVEAHRAAGDLDDEDSLSLVQPRDRRFWPVFTPLTRRESYDTFVQNTLARVARELGVTVDELRSREGEVHRLKNGSSFMLVTRKMAELQRAENAAFREALHKRLLDDFYVKFGREHMGNITEPKTCLSCGRKQEPDGTLSCGH